MRKLALLAAGAAAAMAHAPSSAQVMTAPQTIPREPPSNLETGVDARRFIGDPSKSITRIARDTIMTRAILTAGDPLQNGATGAVLRYRKEIVLGTMQPGEATALASMPDQQVIYIQGGTARLDDGERYWELREGMALLMPGNARNRFTATGEKPFRMVMLTEPVPADPSTSKTILVRDLSKIIYIGANTHWSNQAKMPFDDVGENFLIVYMGPRTIAGPHAHATESEEGWVKLTDAPAWLQIGSEIFPWTAGMGMLAPPNGQSVHAAINTSDSIQAFFYFATLRLPGASAPAPRSRSPGLSMFEQSVLRSNVVSRPLQDGK